MLCLRLIPGGGGLSRVGNCEDLTARRERPAAQGSRSVGFKAQHATTNKGFIGVGAPVKGGNNLSDRFLDDSPQLVRKDEEKTHIGEQRDNEDINKKNTFVKGEGRKARAEETKTLRHPVHGGLEDVFQSDVGAYRETQVDRLVEKLEVRPSAVVEVGHEPRVAAPMQGGNNAAFGGVATETRDLGEVVNAAQHIVNVSNIVESHSKVIGESERGKTGCVCKILNEGVVGKEKKKGREGAPLLDTPPDVDPDIREVAEEG